MTDVVTGGPAYAGPRVVDAGRRAELGRDSDPNGWFVGPVTAPDRFQLLGPGLGGGEGITWRARYRGAATTPLTFSVKQLRRPPGARADWPKRDDVQRWDEQKDLLQYLSVDHLATVLDIFVGAAPHLEGDIPPPDMPPDTPYVVMEWVPGRTLGDEFGGSAAGAGTLGVRLSHLQHVAEALNEVHARTAYGTIGTPALLRDVKPDNCVLDPARGVVLVDIGTMRLVDDGYAHPGFRHPGYTAPEVLDDPLAPREATADLYSLGALAFFCVLGADPPPQVGPAGAGQVIGRELLSAARAARVADAHGFVDHLRLMLHPQPDERPADAAAWARRLRELSSRRPRLGGRGGRVAVAAGVLATAGVAFAVSTLDRDGVTGAAQAAPGSTQAAPVPQLLNTPAAAGTLTVPTVPVSPAPLVTINAPADGSRAKECEVVEGEAHLPAGRTLVLASQDVRSGKAVAGTRRLSVVNDWTTPSSLGVWQATQRFGVAAGKGASRQYRVDVLVVEMAALKRVMKQAKADGTDWHTRTLPATTITAATVTITRIRGTCAAP